MIFETEGRFLIKLHKKNVLPEHIGPSNAIRNGNNMSTESLSIVDLSIIICNIMTYDMID